MVQLAEVQVWGGEAARPDPLANAPRLRPSLDLQVAVNGDDADGAPGPIVAPGDPVTFTYEVTNTGTERLWAIYLWDDELGHIDTCAADRLAAGESMTCVVETVAVAGQYGSRVEANGWDDTGPRLSTSTASTTSVPTTASWSALHSTSKPSWKASMPTIRQAPTCQPGRPVAFTYEVTNVGTERLWALDVWHSGVGSADCPQTMLDLGDSITCTGVAEADAGQIVADVFANAWDASGDRASDADGVAYTGTTDASGPALEIQSYVDGQDADTPPGATIVSGDSAEFRYEVKQHRFAGVVGSLAVGHRARADRLPRHQPLARRVGGLHHDR